jgi:hypothetical protein
MNSYEFISSLVSSLAWPFFSFLIILVLRKYIGHIFKSLESFKWKDAEFGFKKDLAEAESDAQNLKLSSTTNLKSFSLAPKSLYEQAMSLAAISPRAAVVDTWRTVELTTMEVAKELNLEISGNIAGTNVIRKLVNQFKLDGAVLGLYEKLRRIRAEAAHAPNFQVDYDESVKYVELALSLANRLKSLVSEKKK